jgi:hypothetical protein
VPEQRFGELCRSGAFLIGGQVNSTIEHAAAEHGHPEAKPAGKKRLPNF